MRILAVTLIVSILSGCVFSTNSEPDASTTASATDFWIPQSEFGLVGEAQEVAGFRVTLESIEKLEGGSQGWQGVAEEFVPSKPQTELVLVVTVTIEGPSNMDTQPTYGAFSFDLKSRVSPTNSPTVLSQLFTGGYSVYPENQETGFLEFQFENGKPVEGQLVFDAGEGPYFFRVGVSPDIGSLKSGNFEYVFFRID